MSSTSRSTLPSSSGPHSVIYRSDILALRSQPRDLSNVIRMQANPATAATPEPCCSWSQTPA